MFRLKIFILLCTYSFPIFSQSKGQCLSGDCENGECIFRDSSGNEFKGTFVNGKLEGLTEVKFKNNGTFSGVHKNPLRKGKSKFIDPETGKPQYGTWIEGGHCDDQGNCKSWHKFIPDLNVDCVFQGMFRNGRKIGKGGYTCNNGESFDGIYVNDFANGYGQLRYSDGTVFEGEFKNGYLVRK
ncbi:MORN repeat protein [Leptospira kirschneri str. 200803703]|uniref:MORN repeat protein n=1 Tax=Leptospira kirschneri str. 200802841 TaxID=1193047 RepID=A0A828XX97_9LEPT|nr:MORN repeat protein [Leptospira kirschneri]EKO52128.1 MORN repeat protein [Leptospira kirschneri str. 200802841]EMO67805.1 MORN repeat protein [Leptospira kirschneri str. 200803703]EMO77031.1 MORN repeat protein [Leptospira kirschneri str. 200801925]